MSLYTTGEVAKLCNVSVRTVQYYDTRNILKPSSLSEGGRRLYSEDDIRQMKIICFLREAGISIHSIEQFLSGEDPGTVISVLIEQQEKILLEEMEERQKKLDCLAQMKKELKKIEHFSVESLNDIAYIMQNKKKMQKLHALLLISGIPVEILEWGALIYGIATGIWWPMLAYVLVVVLYGFWIITYYFKRVVYICPECHAVFKTNMKEFFWADHTPTRRKLTCTCCGYHGFCVETYGEEES